MVNFLCDGDAVVGCGKRGGEEGGCEEGEKEEEDGWEGEHCCVC